eukprot:scaffold78700_cov32-Tisochrysis_lutea.AAC.2
MDSNATRSRNQDHGVIVAQLGRHHRCAKACLHRTRQQRDFARGICSRCANSTQRSTPNCQWQAPETENVIYATRWSKHHSWEDGEEAVQHTDSSTVSEHLAFWSQ